MAGRRLLIVETAFASPTIAKRRAAGGGNGKAARTKPLVFVRILLRYLDRVDGPLARLARETMKDCERKQRSNDSKYETLSGAVLCRLRDAVGESHWEHALRIQRRVVINKYRRRVLASLKRESNERGESRELGAPSAMMSEMTRGGMLLGT